MLEYTDKFHSNQAQVHCCRISVNPKEYWQFLSIVSAISVLFVRLCVQGMSMVASPWQAGWTAAGVGAGVLLADLVSGVFHWSVDNYGNRDTPVFGSVIEAFQGHHGEQLLHVERQG